MMITTNGDGFEGYDSGALSPDENKPIKSFGKGTKRFWTAVLCIILGVAIAAGAVFAFESIFDGASDPESAAAEYVKASMVYDADGMVEYSSPYNKAVLYGDYASSDRLLKDHLNKAYEKIEKSGLTKDKITVTHISTVEYKEGDDKFAAYMERYAEKADAGEVTAAAAVVLAVDNGTNEATHTYVSVKIGGFWYYFYTQK